MTDLHRAGQILRDTVQSCTARHPSVTSVDLWTSVQLCQDCPDSPGFADGLSFNITSTSTHRVTTLTNRDCGTLSHLTD